MKVLLISANTESINMVTLPLGLGLVCAAVRSAGHEVSFLDLLPEPDPLAAIRRSIAAFGPDVIGISIRNIDDQSLSNPRFLLDSARDAVAQCRACSTAPVVLGGAGYSIFPVESLAFLGADFGVAGDGEVAFPALLHALFQGQSPAALAGVYVAHGGSPAALSYPRDLDALPLWDDALSLVAGPDVWVPVQSRRGCPNDCSYCSTARIQGRMIRCRSPRQVVEQIGKLARSGRRRFYFVDNSFNIPEHQALEVCTALAGLGERVAWRCILYPERVSERLVRAMARAGCSEVALGFESGCQRILREMNKRFTPEDVRRTSDLLADAGIRRMGFLLLGGPGETRESVEESLAFARSLALDNLRITIGIRIYPGTQLARRALADGLIASEDSLLRPAFYLAPGLEPWIRNRVAAAFPEVALR
jgi:radical SAM superfamily enzyme YgiQ (UPF0313 family)